MEFEKLERTAKNIRKNSLQHLFCMQPWEKEDFLQLTK